VRMIPVCSLYGNMGPSLIISLAEHTTADVELLFVCDTRAALKSSDIGPSVVHSG